MEKSIKKEYNGGVLTQEERTMIYFLLVLTTLATSAKAIISKMIGQDSRDMRSMFFLNANMFAVGAIVILLGSLGRISDLFSLSGFSLGLAAVFALFLLFTQLMQILAMSRGFTSLTSLIYSCGFLVPIFYSAIFLEEPLTLGKVLGILVLLFSLVLILPPDKNGRFSWFWLALATLAMLGSGANAVIQKIHQASPSRDELIPFLLVALTLAALFSLVTSLLSKGDSRRLSLYESKRSILLMLLGGVVLGGMNIANLTLAGQLPAVIQYSVSNILSMTVTALAGRIIFGERIGTRKLVGFVLGIAAITVIGIF